MESSGFHPAEPHCQHCHVESRCPGSSVLSTLWLFWGPAPPPHPTPPALLFRVDSPRQQTKGGGGSQAAPAVHPTDPRPPCRHQSSFQGRARHSKASTQKTEEAAGPCGVHSAEAHSLLYGGSVHSFPKPAACLGGKPFGPSVPQEVGNQGELWLGFGGPTPAWSLGPCWASCTTWKVSPACPAFSLDFKPDLIQTASGLKALLLHTHTTCNAFHGNMDFVWLCRRDERKPKYRSAPSWALPKQQAKLAEPAAGRSHPRCAHSSLQESELEHSSLPSPWGSKSSGSVQHGASEGP